ncbi:hypothetical protein [Burkholderia ubonensis]|uniref:hypothetical protein n=1 Tax=Burkholderia ubonensis TaxID=101571 RepID=UPI00211601E1|nr:hypothetical protein [Burkholderia ubonensis]
MKAIIDTAIFLEFSGKEILDLDVSVEFMEQLAGELQCMSEHEKSEVVACIRNLAGSYGDRADFVSGLPEKLGLD